MDLWDKTAGWSCGMQLLDGPVGWKYGMELWMELWYATVDGTVG